LLTQTTGLGDDQLVAEMPCSIVLLGQWQYYHGYCLVVARRHVRELSDFDDAERRHYLEEMCMVANAIKKAFQPLKLNYELLGNQVEHPHWHLFPRYEQDPNRLKPAWLDIERAESAPAERERLRTGPLKPAATAAKLREAIRATPRFS
jgi:diadenosine tetraphosphate (Ap4A) HIT family hydrolase